MAGKGTIRIVVLVVPHGAGGQSLQREKRLVQARQMAAVKRSGAAAGAGVVLAGVQVVKLQAFTRRRRW